VPKHVVTMNKLKFFVTIVATERYNSKYMSLLFLEHKECVLLLNRVVRRRV
jgi:hypothetical protein